MNKGPGGRRPVIALSPIGGRSCGALQDGRSWTDRGGRSWTAARARQRDQPRSRRRRAFIGAGRKAGGRPCLPSADGSKDVSLEPRPLHPKVVEAADRLLRIRLQGTETNSGHRPAKIVRWGNGGELAGSRPLERREGRRMIAKRQLDGSGCALVWGKPRAAREVFRQPASVA
jgi:hypothetical protein